MEKATPRMQKYFDSIVKETNNAYEKAQKARAQGFDPVDEVEVKIVENMAQRAVGLVAVLAPQLVGCSIDLRIIELEKKYGVLDWRVSLVIAEEIALQKFCTFKDTLEAIDIGIRVGFSYHTLGVVNSPLDGVISILPKKRLDGKEYFCISFAVLALNS